MTNDRKEELIDKLLCYLNNEHEREGCSINQLYFNFKHDSEDTNNILHELQISFEDFNSVYKVCIAREYIESYTMSDEYKLTHSGQGRAISVINANNKSVSQDTQVSVGTLNNFGAAQFGNNNIQNIEILFKSLIEQIDKSDAPDVEKKEAKNCLLKFISHPLVNTTIGTTANAIITLLGTI